MSWYSAKILYVAEVEGRNATENLFEESIRVFVSSDLDAAEEKAVLVGRAEEHAYENEDGEVVTWRFLRVLEVQDLCEDVLEDGVEVFSELKRVGVGVQGDDS